MIDLGNLKDNTDLFDVIVLLLRLPNLIYAVLVT
jgi:hypothetical protein